MTRYGFVGLGSMGAPMAGHLADLCEGGDSTLTVWNRTPGREGPLTGRGAAVADNPREMVAGSDVVVVMLPDLEQLMELTDGPADILGAVTTPTVLVICSSVSPQGVRAYAEHVATTTGGLVGVVDAPVSGGIEGAEAGNLAIMAGGGDAEVAAAWPALTAMGTTVRHLGPIGAGSLAKACNQMVVAATLIALSEASVLAESAGLSVQGLLEILAGGFGASRVLEVKAANLTANTYAPTGAARYMVKDLAFVTAESQLTGAAVAQAQLSAEFFGSVLDSGLGDLDVSVVHALIRERAGLPPSPPGAP
ncbi:2-hydroxy-3-oxopropionate reductase [Nakamurella sp. UYEF19]|uniref:NAD(P)-dependent oxidoreductase n=1 Tax=Nakamurella sp. UYEF19 TaxID=1756392 RepID=UPI003391D4DD